MPCLSIFRVEFRNNIVIFEISTLKLVYLQNLLKVNKKVSDKNYFISVFFGWNLEIIQFCLQLADIIGATKICQLILGVHFLESRAVLVLLLKMYYFYTYISGSQGKWKTSASLWTKKRKKVIDMFINMKQCCGHWKNWEQHLLLQNDQFSLKELKHLF